MIRRYWFNRAKNRKRASQFARRTHIRRLPRKPQWKKSRDEVLAVAAELAARLWPGVEP